MNKDELKLEYGYWLETIENIKNGATNNFKTSEELQSLHFAEGFVSAINKSGVFELIEKVEQYEKAFKKIEEALDF